MRATILITGRGYDQTHEFDVRDVMPAKSWTRNRLRDDLDLAVWYLSQDPTNMYQRGNNVEVSLARANALSLLPAPDATDHVIMRFEIYPEDGIDKIRLTADVGAK
jgi:hypothetical protein